MHEHLDKKLCEQFPLLYGERDGDMAATCMCWGFECGDGWYQLIYDLSSKLEPLIAQWREDNKNDPEQELDKDGYPVWYPRASQIKEKFGTLRFYMSSTTDEMYRLICEAENKSGETCEKCGKPGKCRGGGWIACLCDDCANGRAPFQD